MDEEDQIAQIVAGMRRSCPYISPLYAETEGKVEDRRIPFVEGGEMAIAIVVGEDLVPGAPKWNQCINPDSETWVPLIVGVLAMESKRLGGFYIDAPRNEKGDNTYQRCVNAIARMKVGKDDPNDRKLVAKITRPTHYVHRQQQLDIQKAIEMLQAKKPKGKGASPQESIEAVSAPTTPFEQALQEDSFILDTRQTAEPSDEYPQVDARLAAPINADFPDVMPKVTFTVAVVHDAQNHLVGYLVRFLIHDAGWNPGKMLNNIWAYQEYRKEHGGKPNFRDDWPHYRSWSYHPSFPLFALTREHWFKCANACRGFHGSFHDTMEQLANKERPDSYESPTHPMQMCTLKRALHRLHEAGGIVGCSEDYVADEGKTALWPSALDVYSYHSEQVIWDHDELVGLWNQYLPKANPKGEGSNPDLEAYLRRTICPRISVVNQKLSAPFSYRTANQVVHFTQEADDIQADVERLIAAGENAEQVVREANWRQMQKFKLFCLPPKTLVDQLNISHALKAANMWMYRFLESNETITREFELYDPDMSLFGNYVARLILLIEKVCKEVQPVISFKLRGLFSVYQRRTGQLLWNMCAHGVKGTGKSHSTVVFCKEVFIRGTFSTLSRITGAADQTNVDTHDEIRGWDEMPEEKNVDLKKSQMTTGESTVRTMEYVSIAGSRNRIPRVITQTTNYTEIGCQNGYPDEDGPLGSRWHFQLVLDPIIPITEMLNVRVEERLRQETIDTFRVTQFLVLMIEKAMAIYALPCRQPYMGLFLDISSKMVETLRAWGVIPQGHASSRNLLIQSHLARELAIEKAALLTWHVKGAPHHGKPFAPEQVMDVAPHLWVDSEITLLTWTLHANDWIRSEYGTVLRAMCEVVLGQAWDLGKTPYEYFCEDLEGRIRFKVDNNRDHQEQQKATRRHVNLNYLEINAPFKVAVQEIAMHTRPRMLAEDVAQLLVKLSERSFVPMTGPNQRNGYDAEQYLDELRREHRLQRMPKIRLEPGGLHKVAERLIRDNYVLGYESIAARLEGFHFSSLGNMMEDGRFRDDKLLPSQVMILYLWPEEPIGSLNDLAEVAGRLASLRPSQERLRALATCIRVNNPEYETDPMIFLSQETGETQQVLCWALEKGWISHPNDAEVTYLYKPIVTSGAFPHFGSEEDVPRILKSREDRQHVIRIVDLAQKSRRVCFSPMAISLFDPKVIVEAFIYATLCSSTKPGKRILGWTHDEDPTKLQVLNFTPAYIEQTVDAFVQDARPGAVSRTEGIPFKRIGHIERSAAEMLMGVGADPVARGPKSSIEVVRDLDFFAANQHRQQCHGSWPLVVHDTDLYKGEAGTVNYPDDHILDKRAQRENNWEPNEVTPNSRHIAKMALGAEPVDKKRKN